MSNKSQMPPNARKPLAAFLEEARERRAQQQQQAAESQLELVKPVTQKLAAGSIRWMWEMPDGFSLTATYRKRDGVWMIDFSGGECDELTYLPTDDAAAVGVALLSAVRWEHIWRQNAGDFLAAPTDGDDEL